MKQTTLAFATPKKQEKEKQIKVAIIGTAGRGPLDRQFFSLKLYQDMVQEAKEWISSLNVKAENITLVSGGASLSDHIAVDLFLNNPEFDKCILYLPCAFDSKVQRFVDNGSPKWQVNPGRISNLYHERFSKIIGRNSLQEIELARQKGAILDTSNKGFHERNFKVGKSDYLLAFTWGDGQNVTDGGTGHTWTNAKNAVKTHISLHTLLLKKSSKSTKRKHDEQEDEQDLEKTQDYSAASVSSSSSSAANTGNVTSSSSCSSASASICRATR
jgi:hypothetical protein